MQFKLTTGQTITITPAQGADLMRLSGPFRSLAMHPPTDSTAQDVIVAELARALAPYVYGMDVAQICDHFSAYPTDMVYVAARVMNLNTHTPRGKSRQR